MNPRCWINYLQFSIIFTEFFQMVRLYLRYISAISPLYLPISPVSLPYISLHRVLPDGARPTLGLG